MALLITRDSEGTDEVQFNGEGSPVIKTVTLTGAGGFEDTIPKELYLRATTSHYYADVNLELMNEVAGRDWQISLDGDEWANQIFIGEINALMETVVTPFLIRCVVTNDGGANQPVSGVYSEVNLRMTGQEDPAME